MTTAWHRHAAERLGKRAKPDPQTGILTISNDEARRFLGEFYHLDRATQRIVIEELEAAKLVHRKSQQTLLILQ